MAGITICYQKERPKTNCSVSFTNNFMVYLENLEDLKLHNLVL